MAKGAHREKAKALILAMKAKPAEDAAAATALHGTKPPEEQCALALAKAIKDDDGAEILACLKSLFGHFDSEPHDEGPEDSSDGE